MKNIHFSGHIPLAEVVSYFKLAHLYLHLSEHEGFCAPIPESFYLGIPVVAFDAGAVAETMNNGGVLVREKDPLKIAALCHEILSRPELKAAILAGQEKALDKYRQQRHRPDPARLSARPAAMSGQAIIVRYGEISLKGRNRSQFEQELKKDLAWFLKKNNHAFSDITVQRGRIYIHGIADLPDLKKVLGRLLVQPGPGDPQGL